MAFEIVDGMTGTKHISSDDLAALNTATVGKASCVLKYGNDFSLTMASANAATLGTGVGMVGGKRFWNQAPVQLVVETGAQGQKRNDLVVARYAKTSAGIESIMPVVVKGTPTTGTPADPAVTANDLKLWRVPLDGINAGTPVRLFEPVVPLATLGDSVSQLKKDYVVEQGVKSGWQYVKWASGRAECSRAVKTAITKTGNYWLPEVSLPFTFKKTANSYDRFSVFVSSSDYFAPVLYGEYPTSKSVVNTVCCAVENASEKGTTAINYLVRGYWK
ncbi:hypothetical protein [Senegalimassilia faecalis]|uniref:hypothetical protein n=1 Tax=Senegalimassilia faecalis TaxID=2509433 RepID=UPI0030786D5C